MPSAPSASDTTPPQSWQDLWKSQLTRGSYNSTYKRARNFKCCCRSRWTLKWRCHLTWGAYRPILESRQRCRLSKAPPRRHFRCSDGHSMKWDFSTWSRTHHQGQTPHSVADLDKQPSRKLGSSGSVHILLCTLKYSWNFSRRICWLWPYTMPCRQAVLRWGTRIGGQYRCKLSPLLDNGS